MLDTARRLNFISAVISPPPNAAIILPSHQFELVYGADLATGIAQHTQLLHPPVSIEALTAADADWLARVEVLFTGWGAPRLDDALLDRMPALRAVFHAGGTVRYMITERVWERGIVVTTAAGANATPVAEFTFAAVVFALKRAWHQARVVREAHAFKKSRVAGALGSTVGLVSLGRIAQNVAQRLHTMEVNLLAYDPVVPAAVFSEFKTERVSLEALFERSDVVSIHAPWLPATEGMITGDLMRRMKPGATLINTARGAVVREAELCAVLEERPDLQAVLDVTYPEPPDRDSPLYRLRNVFLTPHIAGSQDGECRRLGAWVLEDFHRYLRAEPLRERVTKENVALLA